MTIHHTNVHDAAVHASGWYPLGNGLEVTAVPLVDLAHMSNKGEPLFARLNYDEALAVAAREGARLISPAEVEEIRRVGVQLMPYLGTPIAENAIEHSIRHDDAMWKQLVALGWDRKTVVCGAGKYWVDGAPAGKSRLMGWDKDGAGPGQAWWQPPSVAHNRQHFDDGTTTMLVRHARAKDGLATRIASGLLGAARWLVGGLRPTAALVDAGAVSSLGDALLAEARKDLHVREVGGKNRGPEVDAYNKALGVPLGSSWCASSLTTWLKRACASLGVPMPITGSAGAKTIMTQLQKAGRWVDVAELRRDPTRLRSGMVLVWHRGAPGAWTGHVGVLAGFGPGLRLDTIEGNSGTGPHGEGNRVAEMVRRLDDPLLLGAGWVD